MPNGFEWAIQLSFKNAQQFVICQVVPSIFVFQFGTHAFNLDQQNV
jgi:hypothetical protein